MVFTTAICLAAGSTASGAQTPTVVDTSEPAAATPIIPPGRYVKDVFTIDVDEAGRYTHYVTSPAGILEVGDVGTYSYDDEGRWVVVSESTGCPGCVSVVEWTLVDEALTLTLAPDQNRDIPADERAIVEGGYAQEPSTTLGADQIPDGTYSRVATAAEGEALAIDPAQVSAWVGADGELLIELEFADGDWTMYVTNDAGIREVGTGGTYGYDLAGHVVMIEECCGWAVRAAVESRGRRALTDPRPARRGRVAR
jgi:hypothetical protein